MVDNTKKLEKILKDPKVQKALKLISSKGGRNSVKIRLGGKTKKERSLYMSKVSKGQTIK